MSALRNHNAFVTGSTGGIGLEIAMALHEAGAGVVLHGRRTDSDGLNEARAKKWLPESVPIALGDLIEPMPQGTLDVAEEALRLSPNIDLLVCNAGTFIDQPFLDMDFQVFDRTLKLNVYSQYVLIQHFARLWVKRGIRGRVLLIGSINGRLAEPTHVAYDTSKGAIDAMTRSLCVALAPHGIRVNGMAPGLFVTPLTAPALQNPRAKQWMELHTPNGVVPGADACRGAAVFLLSDAAEHIHGQMLMVDGGMSVWQQPDPPEEWMNHS
jgi:glucose 1-dehydrogenase